MAGLPAEWFNAWLAALGITHLVEGARLGWTSDPVPVALISVPGGSDPAEAIAAAIPSVADLRQLAIANHPRDRFPQGVTIAMYAQAAVRARLHRDFSLAASVTDLVSASEQERAPHGAFDFSAPRGETLWDRLESCREALEGPDTASAVRASLAGAATRVRANGLGFDFRRIGAAVHADTDKYVDPVIECLAFFGLSFFPVRGNGRKDGQRTRGWSGAGRKSTFRWFTWHPLLDRWAIDALLSVVLADPSRDWRGTGLGVVHVYELIPYQRRAQKELTEGFASRLLA